MNYRFNIVILTLCGLLVPSLSFAMEDPFMCKVPRDKEEIAAQLEKDRALRQLQAEEEQRDFLKKQSLNFVCKQAFKIHKDTFIRRLKAVQGHAGCFIAAQENRIENDELHSCIYAIDTQNKDWKLVQSSKGELVHDFRIVDNNDIEKPKAHGSILTVTSSKITAWDKKNDCLSFKRKNVPTRWIDKTLSNQKTMWIVCHDGYMETKYMGPAELIPQSQNTRDFYLYEDIVNRPTLVHLTREGRLSLWDPITKKQYNEIAQHIYGISVIEFDGHTILGTISHQGFFPCPTIITLWDISNRAAYKPITSISCEDIVTAIGLYKDHLGYPCIVTAGQGSEGYVHPFKSTGVLTLWEPQERIRYLKTTQQDLQSHTPLPKVLVTKVLGYVGSEEHTKQRDHEPIEDGLRDEPEKPALPQIPLAQPGHFEAQLKPHKTISQLTKCMIIGFASGIVGYLAVHYLWNKYKK
ncbi:MAG: hypothetical protein ACHQVS_04360 [Candidatus Babeliales bacterium]